MHPSRILAGESSDIFSVGSKQDGSPVNWGFSKASNFNMCLLGESGSGKTHFLRRMISEIVKQGVTIHILDVKDDFSHNKFLNDGLLDGGYVVNDLDFGYVGGDTGLNILQFPSFAEGGGVYMATQDALEIVRMFNTSFSGKMEGYLTQIIKNVYKNHGVSHEDQSTWGNKPPTLKDVLIEINFIEDQLATSLPLDMLMGIGNLVKKTRLAIADEDEKEERIEEAKAVLKDKFNEYVDRGMEKERHYFSSWKLETILSIKDTVSSMVDTEIFTRPTKNRMQGAINRYRLVGLNDRHRQIIMRIVMSQVFHMSVSQTIRTGNFDPKVPSHFLIFDEGKHAKQLEKSEMSPLNRIATEGRGYGVGMGVGVQLVKQVTEEMLKNFSTRVILKLQESSYPEAIKNFGATKTQLKQLRPKSNCLFGTGEGYSIVNSFR
jgi:hypothetical protein